MPHGLSSGHYEQTMHDPTMLSATMLSNASPEQAQLRGVSSVTRSKQILPRWILPPVSSSPAESASLVSHLFAVRSALTRAYSRAAAGTSDEKKQSLTRGKACKSYKKKLIVNFCLIYAVFIYISCSHAPDFSRHHCYFTSLYSQQGPLRSAPRSYPGQLVITLPYSSDNVFSYISDRPFLNLSLA